jgi:hypothetical protein
VQSYFTFYPRKQALPFSIVFERVYGFSFKIANKLDARAQEALIAIEA